MRRYIIFGVIMMILLVSAIVFGLYVKSNLITDISDDTISNFDECIAAGNPAMESYPRQCRSGDQTFTEVLSKMNEADARKIAEKNCIKGGESIDFGYYNENSKTWWFDANLNAAQSGCNPACVVYEETGETEINWRCTGLIEN